MNDNEIIQALECCATEGKCKECPAYETYKYCLSCVLSEAFDLINRQRAEIERYKRENDSNFDKWKLLDERTQKRYAELYKEAKAVVRAEAVKEFAERLKATPMRFRVEYVEYFDRPSIEKKVLFIDDNDIDNLVKEMVGED